MEDMHGDGLVWKLKVTEKELVQIWCNPDASGGTEFLQPNAWTFFVALRTTMLLDVSRSTSCP